MKTLRQRRIEMHMTQEMLAERCGCLPRYLRDLECGRKTNPSAGLVIQFLDTLAISAAELLVVQSEESGPW